MLAGIAGIPTTLIAPRPPIPPGGTVPGTQPGPGGGGPVSALDEFTKRINNASLSLQQFAEKMRGGAGGTGTGGTPRFGGKEPPEKADAFGGIKAALAAIGPVYAVMRGLQSGAEFGANALNIQQNASLSNFQKERATAEALPIVGGLSRSLHNLEDAINGTTEAIRKNREQMERDTAYATAAMQSGRAIQGQRFQQFEAQARDEANRAIPFTRPRYKGDILDERAIRQFEREAPLALADTQAKRGVETQKNLIGKLDSELVTRQEELGIRQRDAARLASQRRAIDREGKKTSEPGFFDAVAGFHQHALNPINKFIANRIEGAATAGGVPLPGEDRRKEAVAVVRKENEAILGVERNIAAVQAIQEQKKQALVNLARAEAEQAKAALEHDKARLAGMQEIEGRFRGQAAAAGGMNAAEKALALQALRQAKEKGFESLQPVQQQWADRVAHDWVEQQRIRKGEADPFTREVRELTGERKEDIAKGLAGVRQERMEVQARVDVQLNLNQQDLDAKVAKAIDRIGDLIIDAIKKNEAVQRQKFDLSIFLRHILGGQ